MRLTLLGLWVLLIVLVVASVSGLIAVRSMSISASAEIPLDASWHAGALVGETAKLLSEVGIIKHDIEHGHPAEQDSLSFRFGLIHSRILTLSAGEIYGFVSTGNDITSQIASINEQLQEIEKFVDSSALSLNEYELLHQLVSVLDTQSRQLYLAVSRFSQHASNAVGQQIRQQSQVSLISFLGTIVVGSALFSLSLLEYRRRNQVTQELSKLETNYRTLFETSDLFICTLGADGYITDANEACRRITGYSKDKILATHIREIGTPRDVDRYKTLMNKIISGELHGANFEWKYTTKDGQTKYGDVSTTGIYNIDGSYQGSISVIKDITDKLKAERALQQREFQNRKFNSAYYSLITHHHIFHTSPDKSFQSIISAVLEALDLTLCSIWFREKDSGCLKCQASSLNVGNPPAVDQSMSNKLIEQLEKEKTIILDVASCARTIMPVLFGVANGNALLVSIHAEDRLTGFIIAIKKGDNNEWGFDEQNFMNVMTTLAGTVVETDTRRSSQAELKLHKDKLEEIVETRTSELVKTNAQLSETLSTLEKTNSQLVQSEKLASLGSLVAGVAHEINTPLGNSITVATTLEDKTKEFKDELKTDAVRRNTLEDYVNDVNTASNLLSRNLFQAARMVASFKRIAVDQTSSIRRQFNCKELTEEVLMTLSPTISKTKIRCEIDIPESIELDSYPGDYGQVVSNLVLNAVTHAFEQEDQSGLIRIEANMECDYAVFRISDNGKGIPEDYLKKIFDPFFTTKMGSGGSGLGLNIAHSIVNGVLGGSITADSEMGKGTVFTIVLPQSAPMKKQASK